MKTNQSAPADFTLLLSFMQERFRILPLDPPGCPAHFVLAVPREDALEGLPRSLHPEKGRIACGRGITPEAALASCLGETAELLCSAWREAIATTRAAPSDLEGSAIYPSELMLSDALPAAISIASLNWVEVQDLDQREVRRVPAGSVYLDQDDRWPCDSNGCAAAPRIEQAVIRATLELIERDATAIWWFGMYRRPEIPLERFADPALSALASWHSDQGRRHHLLDLTTDFGIPIYGAVSSDLDGRTIALGFSAHPDPTKAALSAFTEMLQIEFSLTANRGSTGAPISPDLKRWQTKVSLETAPYLIPSGEGMPKLSSATPREEGPELLEYLKAALQARGIDLWWRDLSRSEVGMPVVRVFAPGLRHTKGGIAPGRLYDVPPTIGWSDRAPDRQELNHEPLAV